MRLRSLRKLEEIELRNELSKLENEQNNLNDILNSIDVQWKEIYSDIKNLKKDFQDISYRKTEISDLPLVEEFDEDELINKD